MVPELNRVLVVDDEPDIRMLTSVTLEMIGNFTVETAENGLDALDKAPAFNPELILLDVMMPVMDGPATLKKFREIEGTKNVPVVFLTAKVQAHEIDELLATGATAVLSKPFDPNTIVPKIQEIWQKHHS